MPTQAGAGLPTRNTSQARRGMRMAQVGGAAVEQRGSPAPSKSVAPAASYLYCAPNLRLFPLPHPRSPTACAW
jgi:hypothetical protein